MNNLHFKETKLEGGFAASWRRTCSLTSCDLTCDTNQLFWEKNISKLEKLMLRAYYLRGKNTSCRCTGRQTKMNTEFSSAVRNRIVQSFFQHNAKSFSWHVQGPREPVATKTPRCWFRWTAQQYMCAQPRSLCRWVIWWLRLQTTPKDLKRTHFSDSETQTVT